MKIRTEIKYFFYKPVLTTIILFFILLCSCTEKERESNSVKGRIIPQKDFISILSDLYLTDGLITVPQIRDLFPDKDSITVYLDVIADHGYTKEEMDATLEYYYLKKPKKLIKIFDQILGQFTEIDTRLSNIPYESASYINNEWKGPTSLFFPELSGTVNPEFSLPIRDRAYYSLTFTVTVYPFDQTVNPRFTVWLCRADSSETGKKYFLPSFNYIKDGFPHTYNVTGTIYINSPAVLKGTLYDMENNPEEGERYGKIENIQFITSGGI